MSRLKLVASAAFFFGYLLFQAGYPAYARLIRDSRTFTWPMYARLSPVGEYVVVHEDGSRRRLPPLAGKGSPFRIYSPVVRVRQFVVPQLCERLPGMREVHFLRRGRTVVIPCTSSAR